MSKAASITVFGLKIKVLLADLSNEDSYGRYSPDRKLIVIHKGLDFESRCETLWHELAHAVQFRSGLFYEPAARCYMEIMAENTAQMIMDLQRQGIIKFDLKFLK